MGLWASPLFPPGTQADPGTPRHQAVPPTKPLSLCCRAGSVRSWCSPCPSVDTGVQLNSHLPFFCGVSHPHGAQSTCGPASVPGAELGEWGPSNTRSSNPALVTAMALLIRESTCSPGWEWCVLVHGADAGMQLVLCSENCLPSWKDNNLEAQTIQSRRHPPPAAPAPTACEEVPRGACPL